VANCITCGDELHPERTERYDYCTKPDCVQRNATGLPIVAVRVNKAADQYILLNERTRQEMAGGRYRKHPEVLDGPRRLSRAPRVRIPARAPVLVPRPERTSRPRWSDTQERLTLIYRDMGMKPHEIAKKIGVSPYLVTQILLNAS
jgi:hypothetical protein